MLASSVASIVHEGFEHLYHLLVGAAATGEGSRGGVGGSLNHDGVSTDTGYSVT